MQLPTTFYVSYWLNKTKIHDDLEKNTHIKKGKRKFTEGFVRWCERGDVGLSQQFTVEEVIDEFPTGMYDDFYVNTGR